VAFATDGVGDFLTGTLKTDSHDFVSKLEGHAIQGLKGISIRFFFESRHYCHVFQALLKTIKAGSLRFGVRSDAL
jgi:hypothetical protein